MPVASRIVDVARGEVRERREGVAGPELGHPHGVGAEPLGLADELDAVGLERHCARRRRAASRRSSRRPSARRLMPSSVARMLASNSARRRATIRSSFSGIAVMAIERPDGAGPMRVPAAAARCHPPRRARTTTRPTDRRHRSRTNRTHEADRSGSRSTRSPTLRSRDGCCDPRTARRRAALRPATSRADELAREARRQLDVGDELPHPLDRRVDQDVGVDGGAVGVEHVASRPALRRRACAARRGSATCSTAAAGS